MSRREELKINTMHPAGVELKFTDVPERGVFRTADGHAYLKCIEFVDHAVIGVPLKKTGDDEWEALHEEKQEHLLPEEQCTMLGDVKVFSTLDV